MKLLTKEITDKLPKLYATENIPTDEKKVIFKMFTPTSNWSWFVVEGEQQDGDFMMFGLVQGFETEWGYFSLNELKSAKGPMGLGIERDKFFKPCTVSELKTKHPELANA